MLCTAPGLRTAAISCRIQPTLLTTCTYHTASPSPLRAQDSSSSTTPPHRRLVSLPKRHVSFKKPSHTHISLRSASTASSSPSAARANTTTTAANTPSDHHLDWNTFFKLRRTRRFYQLGSSVGTGITGFISGAQVLTRTDMDALVGQIPLDPFITLGLITFTCGGIGWLVGPILGTAAFNLKNRKFRSQMDEKEKEFYRRVKRFRVDPSASSMANPVPGEFEQPLTCS